MNFNSLEKNVQRKVMREKFHRVSTFQKRCQSDMFTISCRDYAEALKNILLKALQDKQLVSGVSSLETLHEHLPDELKAYNFDDGVNKISTNFYDVNDEFIEVYHSLIRHISDKILNGADCVFQDTPTVRLHTPDSKNNDHYPRYHTDIVYGHPPEEINIWIPLTERLSGHGFRRLSVDDSVEILDSYDYDFDHFISDAIGDDGFTQRCHNVSQEVDTQYGELLLFDSRCIHSGMPMKDHTRVSIDVRVIPLQDYTSLDYSYQGKGRRQTRFEMGECYSTCTSSELSIKESI